MTFTASSLVLFSLFAQPGIIATVDVRGNRLEEATGTSWRVFAVASDPDGPLDITEVQEVRQYNPPSTWGVLVQNRSLAPVKSYTMAAAVVSVDGKVKAIQPLPAIKNLEPSKVRRQEVRIIATVLMPTDRVVFFVNEHIRDTAPWKAAKADIAAIIKAVADRLPVP